MPDENSMNSDPRFLGVKIASVGFLVVIAGVGLFFLGFKQLGSIVNYAGIAIGIVGITAHILLPIIRKIRKK